jgi:glycerol kinase
LPKYILALDQGTTSSRAMLFDRDQNIVTTARREITQIYPREGWVEHDPMEIWQKQRDVMERAVAQSGVCPRDIEAIGITNQRETTVVWDKKTGSPVCNAIVWQCRRTAGQIDRLVSDGLSRHIREATGLIPDAYFSGTKIAWILDNVKGAREKAERSELLFGTVDSWLLWNLTGGKVHAADYTNASRTMIYDIHKLDWDETLLRALNIPRGMLPEVRPSSGFLGAAEIGGFEIPVAGMAGDQQAALFGQCCFEQGDTKITYGTGCFMLTHTGNQACSSQNGLLTTLAAGQSGEKPPYALEGSVFAGGSTVQWLRDGLRFFEESCDIEAMARKVNDSGGVYIVPAFTGLGAPHWDMYARGCIIGLTRGSTREHIARAVEECIAYQCNDLIKAMERDTGGAICKIKADGGAVRDSLLMQLQADISGVTVHIPAVNETTALGAATLAGLAVGLWKDTEEIKQNRKQGSDFIPASDENTRKNMLKGWDKAVGRSLGWAERGSL